MKAILKFLFEAIVLMASVLLYGFIYLMVVLDSKYSEYEQDEKRHSSKSNTKKVSHTHKGKKETKNSKGNTGGAP